MSNRARVRLGAHVRAPLPRRHTALYSAIESGLRQAGDGVVVGGSPLLTASRATLFGAALSLAILAPVGAVDAATITVDSSAVALATDGECTLPEAVANANADADTTGGDCAAGGGGLDTIVFDPTLANSTISLAATLPVLEPLAIEGPGRDDLAIESTFYGSMIAAVAPLQVSGLEFRYGAAPAGGAILSESDLDVGASRFLYNRASIGGAIASGTKYGDQPEPGTAVPKGAASRQVLIDDTEFLYNGAYPADIPIGLGGAVAVVFESAAGVAPALTVSNSLFRGNRTRSSQPERGAEAAAKGNSKYDIGFGGALFAVSEPNAIDFAPTVAIQDTEFERNRSPIGGGAFLATPSITIDGGTFADNQSGLVGGGLAVIGSKYGSTTRPDSLASRLAVTDGDLAIDGTQFRYNAAGRGGGAMVYASTVDVQDAVFERNRTFGAYLYSPSPDRSRAKGDPAPSCAPYYGPDGDGGGLAARAETSIVIGGASEFRQNCASDDGGGARLSLVGGASLEIGPDASASQNFAYDSGGGFSVETLSGSSVTLSGTVSGNVASYGRGGGLDLTAYGASTIEVSDATLQANRAYGAGGGLSLRAVVADGDVARGSFALRDSQVLENQSGGDAGGGVALYVRGASYAVQELGSSVLVSGSTIAGNSAEGRGGGLFLSGSDIGDVAVTASTIEGNATDDDAGGGIAIDVEGSEDATLASFELSASTIVANRAAFGGGLWLGIDAVTAGAARIVNTTIHANLAQAPVMRGKGFTVPVGSGAGVMLRGAEFGLEFVTVTDNVADAEGGGILVDGAGATLRNSIVAGNGAGGTGPDVFGAVDADFTLFGDAGGATITGANNDVGSDPLLGPLADNGGPTQTRLPLDGSPAIDSGDPAFAPPPAEDQRGAGFPRVDPVVGIVDKGAVETEGVVVVDVTSLTIAPDPFAEGAASTLSITTSAAAPADVLVTIDFSGVAGLGTDFTAEDDDAGTAGIQVRVPAGASSGSIQLQAIADAIDEPDETFTAAVGTVTGANLPAPLSDTATITDANATPTVTISLGDAELAEGESTTIIATLSGPSDRDVIVTLSFAGVATLGSDYSTGDADPGTPGIQIVIPAGATTASIALNALNDAANEPNESIVINIQSVTNGVAGGGAATTGIITGSGSTTVPIPTPAVIPTLSEWMLMLLALLLPASVITRLRGQGSGARKR
jgi:hypothetical protein